MDGMKLGRATPPRWMGREPLPQVANRLRSAFPELWTRYKLLAAARGEDEPARPDRPGARRPEH
jgi:hypothetical protein